MKSIRLPVILSALVCAVALSAHAADSIPEELVNKGFNTLNTAIGAAGLSEALSAPGPFTVFAPNDAAFKKLPADKLEALLKDKEKLAEVLKNHVVEGKVSSSDLKAGKVTTLGGTELDIKASNGGVTVGGAGIVEARKDVDASNGVIHGIDTVLLP